MERNEWIGSLIFWGAILLVLGITIFFIYDQRFSNEAKEERLEKEEVRNCLNRFAEELTSFSENKSGVKNNG